MANTNISLINLDPDTLKANYIQWLQNNSAYRDYNYAGSNINAELDVLVRNTFLNSFFLNMTFSEGFNDSAQLRDSIVSKSKELNYLPYSVSSATTDLNISLQTANATMFEIPKGTIFSGYNSNGSYNFVTDQNYLQTSSNGFFSFSNVAVYEGFYKSDLFSVDTTVNNQLFTLSDPGIDTTSLTIVVSENSGSTNTIFTLAPNLYGLNGNSKVYFLQGHSSNTYQFQFGDGVFGYQPQNGAVVNATYRISQGDAANFVNTFTLSSGLQTYNNTSYYNLTITTANTTSGGAPAESIDSIRFNNPRHYETQNNAITDEDYKTLILDNFPYVKDVNVYSGGVTPTGIQYGMIFISLVTTSGNPATQILKSNIQAFLQKRNILNYAVQFIDPDFIYLNVSSNVHVDFTQTNVPPNQYVALVANAINDYSSNSLETFDTAFRYSQLTDAIDEVDASVISNETTVTIKKFANVILNVNNFISINYNNPITNVTSNPFIISGGTYYLSDTALGNANGIVYLVNLSGNATPTNVGSVNYSNGIVTIPSLNVSGYVNNGVAFTASTLNKDIYAVGNDIIEVDSTALNINIVSD